MTWLITDEEMREYDALRDRCEQQVKLIAELRESCSSQRESIKQQAMLIIELRRRVKELEREQPAYDDQVLWRLAEIERVIATWQGD